MFSTVFGLPLHPLVVHAVVVLLPIAAVAGIVVAVWPAARARYALPTLLVATAALVSIPLATQSGEWLEDHVTETELVERHTEMGDRLLPFALVFWVALVVVFLADRYGRARMTRWVGLGAAVLTVVFAIISGVQVVRIGDSGAQAAWHGVVKTTGDTDDH